MNNFNKPIIIKGNVAAKKLLEVLEGEPYRLPKDFNSKLVNKDDPRFQKAVAILNEEDVSGV